MTEEERILDNYYTLTIAKEKHGQHIKILKYNGREINENTEPDSYRILIEKEFRHMFNVLTRNQLSMIETILYKRLK